MKSPSEKKRDALKKLKSTHGRCRRYLEILWRDATDGLRFNEEERYKAALAWRESAESAIVALAQRAEQTIDGRFEFERWCNEMEGISNRDSSRASKPRKVSRKAANAEVLK